MQSKDQSALEALKNLFGPGTRYNPATYQQVLNQSLKWDNLVQFLVDRATDGYLVGYEHGAAGDAAVDTYPAPEPWQLPQDCHTLAPYDLLSWGNRAARVGLHAGAYDGCNDRENNEDHKATGLARCLQLVKQLGGA